MKKLLSITVSILIFFSLFAIPVTPVSAAGNKAVIVETQTEYTTFKGALGAAADGQTIKLLADDTAVYMGGNITNWGGAKTIDLNGFTLTCTGERFLSPGSGNWSFVIKNGTLQNMATVTFQSFFMLRANVTITLDNVTLKDVATAKTSGYGFIGTATDKTGVLNFRNCTVTEAAKPAASGFNVAGSTVNFYNTSVTAASPIFYANSTYNVYSGVFTATNGSTLATPTIPTTSIATDSTDSQLTVICNHKAVNGVCEYCGENCKDENSYNVTIDDSTASVKRGEKYTFPALDESTIAYTNGTDYYFGGDEIDVKGDLTFTSVKLTLSMQCGAAMRLNYSSGLRYYTSVDTEQLAALMADGATVKMGTLIAPSDLLGESALALEIAESKRIDVKYEANNFFTDGSFVGIVGSITDVKDENANRRFVGRGYATVTLSGVTKTVYASYASNSVLNNTRTIGYVATLVKEGDEYAKLRTANRAVVDKYANLYNEG